MEDTGTPAWEGAPPRTVSDLRMGKHRHRETGHPGRAVTVLLALKSSGLERDLPHMRGGGQRREEDLAGSSGGPHHLEQTPSLSQPPPH